MKVAIVGTGYVGLISGSCLAEKGHYVTCVDIDSRKVNLINKGECPVYEAGLSDLVAKNVQSGKLKATNDLSDGLKDAKISIISVGTPFTDGSIDLNYVKKDNKNK